MRDSAPCAPSERAWCRGCWENQGSLPVAPLGPSASGFPLGGALWLQCGDSLSPSPCHTRKQVEGGGEKRLINIIFLSWFVLYCPGLQNFNCYLDAEWLQTVTASPNLMACLHTGRPRLLLLHFQTAQNGGSFTLRRKLCG